MEEPEILALAPDLVQETSMLLAEYRYTDGWGRQRQEECKEALNRLLNYHNAYCFIARVHGESAKAQKIGGCQGSFEACN